ncbi:hypothetical protein Sango_2358700 [Sesamum angolense]|uniref:Uncharacterized protein n=1 Tax=Sesamum angolense TaxID=2727404 RepID=A0AAE1W676_9LAMI|nr:hypothetical protein Sango_2358700 [Sesamum angolense]
MHCASHFGGEVLSVFGKMECGEKAIKMKVENCSTSQKPSRCGSSDAFLDLLLLISLLSFLCSNSFRSSDGPPFGYGFGAFRFAVGFTLDDFLLAADMERCCVGRSDAMFNTWMKE